MNIERILQLADVIEKTPHKPLPPEDEDGNDPPSDTLDGFNMRDWHCGTVGCIAGWAGQMFECDYWDAHRALGLDEETGKELFQPERVNYAAVEPSRAAAVLRNLAATGAVDWSIP